MATHVFFLNTLRPGVDAGEYERWLREVDYPTARALPAIRSYLVVRAEGPLRDGDVPCDYLEIVEIDDLGEYREAIAALPGREQFLRQLRSYVGGADAFHGTVVS
ncbi:MAG: hypothetical protein QOI21_2454 [Actinomycetota bacterium]|nr:hypothetical protein [Actinomycetota bacterium]